MVRGTGKFKQKRGGGRNFSRDMILDHEDLSARRKAADDSDEEEEDDDKEGDDSDDDSDEESGEEESTPAGTSAPAQPELTREERRDLKRKQTAEKQAKQATIDEDGEDADLINPNHVQRKLNISDLGSEQMTRKERDAKEKQEAKDRYWKLHVAGKTDEAKSDLARLKRIREEREAAQAKRKAEADAKAAEVEAKKKAAMNGKRI